MIIPSIILAGLFGFGAPTEPEKQSCHKNCLLSEEGIVFIREFEGYYPYVYKDSAGLDTIGIGHLIKPGEKFDTPLMAEAAKKLFLEDAHQAIKAVNKRVNVKLEQNQADALISLTYNIGGENFGMSTLLKFVNSEKHQEAPEWFLPWNKVTLNGKKVPVKGLTRRRVAEAKLYKGE